MDIKYKPELLVPAGDFECLRAGVQNGADAIYFGSSYFSARANAKNFEISELKDAISYCKIRNVKTNLTINTLLTDDEFSKAVELAKIAYEDGIDAIIVQDLGFAKFLIDNFPNLGVHASTQMTIHNLEGVLELEKLGFNRVVLARELPINEIEYIRNNTNIELETFIHGALCISYSGQCLFSSLVGGRSGNRGKCAQPCRLPYSLLEDSSIIDKGYLLSPRDLCGLKYLPDLIKAGVNSFKVEGRMKTPQYVATVTKIYRKYIDKILNNENSKISEEDYKDLAQVFNRGGFSSGHLDTEPNKDLVFSDKPNNIGLYVGNISNYNAAKGHITIKLNEPIAIGDTISIDGESGQYTVSEIIMNNQNFKDAEVKSIVVLGRMKGNIKIGSRVYKMSSKKLCSESKLTYCETANLKKIPINCNIKVKKDEQISVEFSILNNPPFYSNICVKYVSDIRPEASINCPITKDRIIQQFSKLGNTPFSLNSINVDLDDNLHIPSISILNDIRRDAIGMLIKKITDNSDRNLSNVSLKPITNLNNSINLSERKISVLLENINCEYDYSKLNNFDNLYIPLKFFVIKKYSNVLINLSTKFNMYVYMPNIMKANYKNLFLNDIDEIVNQFNIKGFVISNMAGFIFLKKYLNVNDYNIVANYTMNIFNDYTITELKELGVNTITPSIELNSSILENLMSHSILPIELIVYGRSVLMNTSYCLLGKTNNCYPKCDMKCTSKHEYYLKDRLGFKFKIVPDNVQTVTSIYNSKITSIDSTNFNVSSIRVNILSESIDEINDIILKVKSGKKLEGIDYTNGNLNRNI